VGWIENRVYAADTAFWVSAAIFFDVLSGIISNTGGLIVLKNQQHGLVKIKSDMHTTGHFQFWRLRSAIAWKPLKRFKKICSVFPTIKMVGYER